MELFSTNSNRYIYVLYPFLCSLFCCLLTAHADWRVYGQLNPGCTVHCDDKRLVYINAKNATNSVHMFFDASVSAPSVLLAYSSNPDAKAQIDWSVPLNASKPSQMIKVPGVIQSYALVLLSLVDYNDTTDVADLSVVGADNVTFSYMKSWNWTMHSKLQMNESQPIKENLFEVLFAANLTNSPISVSGSVQVRFMVVNSNKRNELLPALSFVPGMSLQMELSLDGLVSKYSRGRFGLQLALLSNESVHANEDYVRTAVFSIDDEMTPGIFEMVNINFGQVRTVDTNTPVSAFEPKPPAFIQTRPICYASNGKRDIKTSRDVRVNPHRNVSSRTQRRELRYSLPYLFYGDRYEQQFNSHRSRQSWAQQFDHLAPIGLRIQNISFGTPGDGFYNASKYLVWTMSFGLGDPPRDKMSSLLIGLISFSVCVILASLIFGSLVLFVLRRRRRATNPTQFTVLAESTETFSSVSA